MMNNSHIIALGVAVGAAIGAAMTAAARHATVWLPLAIGTGLAIAVAIRDRRQSASSIDRRQRRSSVPS
jgi:uncharacterized membrane protein YoaK (UPF0700 family)